LTAAKGLPYLIEALPKVVAVVPGVRLELVGDGDYRGEILRRIAEVGLEKHVRLTGDVPHTSMPKVYSRADILVFPSLAEGHAKTPIEALACGLPVVGTRIGGVVETVREEENGILVPPKDADALAAALIRLLTDRNLYTRLHTQARDSVMRFSIEHVTQEHIALYCKLRRYSRIKCL
jgi:glycosyltransferase involved in cell wall biosynthesis